MAFLVWAASFIAYMWLGPGELVGMFGFLLSGIIGAILDLTKAVRQVSVVLAASAVTKERG